MVGKTNLKIIVYDPDFYGLHAINSYLAWDRRTRVILSTTEQDTLFEWLAIKPETEQPDLIVLDTSAFATAEDFRDFLLRIRAHLPEVQLLVLEHWPRLDFAEVSLELRAEGYFLRNDVGLQIAWTVVWAQSQSFAISPGVQEILTAQVSDDLRNAIVLPDQRQYPELTDRIRQALKLCVVEGMSADLAADEMGVSPHTVRSYIKEGYRIMEAYDQYEYPPEMSAQERAFMRFTAFEEEEFEEDQE